MPSPLPAAAFRDFNVPALTTKIKVIKQVYSSVLFGQSANSEQKDCHRKHQRED
jgi:hypothetical protein